MAQQAGDLGLPTIAASSVSLSLAPRATGTLGQRSAVVTGAVRGAPNKTWSETMQPVVRALDVLRELARAKKGLTLHELHARLDIPVASTHRVLATLFEEGFVTRSPTNLRYFLGPAARELAEENAPLGALLVAVHPAASAVAETTGETVFLTELHGNRAVCVGLVEGRYPLRLFVRIGQEMPLHAAASARTLLAYQEEQVARSLLSSNTLTSYTSQTPTEPAVVMDHLTVIRARGYDVCDDELDHGVWAVSAPVFISTGRVCASVTLAAAGGRMRNDESRIAAIKLIQAAANRMSEELGSSPSAVPDPGRQDALVGAPVGEVAGSSADSAPAAPSAPKRRRAVSRGS